ncbi:MAG: TRAP transporter small permease [Pseudomonadota bacterium]
MGDPIDSIEAIAKEQEISADERLKQLRFSAWDIPLLLVFLALFATVFLQFFTRYVLNDSLSWTEEASRYLLILLAFVGASKCQSLDSHIRLEVVDQVAGRFLPHLKIFALCLTIFFFGFLGYALVELAQRTSFQNMVSLPFPKYYLYTLVVISIGVCLIVQLRQVWALVRGLRR